MKILHLCDSLNPAGLGGYESYLHYLSQQLAERGHESVVVTQAPTSDTPESIIRDHYRVLYLRGNLLEARKWMFYALPEGDREVEADQMFRKDDLELNVQALRGELLSVIREFKPDIIHAHSTYVVFNRVLLGLKEEGSLNGVPILVTIHGRPKLLILPSGKRTTDYDEFCQALPFSLILGVSHNVTDMLKHLLQEKRIALPVHTLYLGIDLKVFSQRRGDKKVWDVAYMGRLEKMKAVDLFPEMLSMLRRENPTLRFLMTGDGSLRESLLRQFEAKGVSDLVEYRGVVEAEEVPKLLNQSRIFIYPSREEPFGLSILEAMACGVPVVTSNILGPSEILTDNFDGIMVVPDSVKELTNGIHQLLHNDALRATLGRNARKTVESKFDVRLHCDKLLKVYHDLILTQKE
jgi:glycosyltransferase involved in cell wall biosynthesis